ISALDNPITISADTTIIGNYRVTIDGGGSAQIFVVNHGVTAIIENLSLTNGHTSIGSSEHILGGAILNYGTLILKNCRFANNSSPQGGAIFNQPGAVLNVSQSTFLGNIAGIGGAIYNQGSAVVINSTFSGNVARGVGGALVADHSSISDGTMAIIHST